MSGLQRVLHGPIGNESILRAVLKRSFQRYVNLLTTRFESWITPMLPHASGVPWQDVREKGVNIEDSRNVFRRM